MGLIDDQQHPDSGAPTACAPRAAAHLLTEGGGRSRSGLLDRVGQRREEATAPRGPRARGGRRGHRGSRGSPLSSGGRGTGRGSGTGGSRWWWGRLRALQVCHVPIWQIGHEVAVRQAAPQVVHGCGAGQGVLGAVGSGAVGADRSGPRSTAALSGTTRLFRCPLQTEASLSRRRRSADGRARAPLSCAPHGAVWLGRRQRGRDQGDGEGEFAEERRVTSARLQCWGGGGARRRAGAKALSAVLKEAVRKRHAASCSPPPSPIGDAQFGEWGWGGCLSEGSKWVVRKAPHPASSWSSKPISPTRRTLCRYSPVLIFTTKGMWGLGMEAHPETQK